MYIFFGVSNSETNYALCKALKSKVCKAQSTLQSRCFVTASLRLVMSRYEKVKKKITRCGQNNYIFAVGGIKKMLNSSPSAKILETFLGKKCCCHQDKILSFAV